MNLGKAASSDDDSNPDGLSEKAKFGVVRFPKCHGMEVGWGMGIPQHGEHWGLNVVLLLVDVGWSIIT